MANNKKFYAVRVGKNPGIYDSWGKCSQEVVGFYGAEYKSFQSIEEAEGFMKNLPQTPSNTNSNGILTSSVPFSYIDGSFDVKTGNYSFGCVLIQGESVIQFKKAYPNDEFSVHRNVAGEIKGAGFIIQYAINHGIKELDIYYDYLGIEKWFTGEWKASKPISIAYVNFANTVRDKIRVNFHKVKSHSNVYYNEMVDKLAKDALGIG